MKKIYLISIILLFSSPIFAQQYVREADGFGVSASWGHSFGGDKSGRYQMYDFGYPDYWSVNINADYKKTFFRALFARPSVGLYYANHKLTNEEFINLHKLIGLSDFTHHVTHEVGGNLGAMIGVTKYFGKIGIEVETGPYSNIKLYSKMKAKYKSDNKQFSQTHPSKYFLLYWRVGANVNFGRFQGKISYDIATMNYYAGMRAADCLSVGIGYRF